MKGIFNKVLVMVLLVSACGIRAEVTDMSGKQLLAAAAVKLTEEGKVAVQSGFNVLKNSKAVSAVVSCAQSVSTDPVFPQSVAAVKVVGRTLSAQAIRVAELSKSALTKVPACVVRGKDAAKAFCVEYPELTGFAAFAVLILYLDYRNEVKRVARYEELRDGERDLSESEQNELAILEDTYETCLQRAAF